MKGYENMVNTENIADRYLYGHKNFACGKATEELRITRAITEKDEAEGFFSPAAR